MWRKRAVLAAVRNLDKYYITKLPKRQEKGANITAYKKKTNNPKMGRPTTAPRNFEVKVRLSQTENDILEDCVRKSGRTKTDVIVKGIALVQKELTK